MPRGSEYVGGPPASDNAIDAGENEIAGAPQGSDQPTSSGIDRSHKAAPMPEGITEMKDGSLSGGGSQGLTGGGSGKGGKDEPFVDKAAEKLKGK